MKRTTMIFLTVLMMSLCTGCGMFSASGVEQETVSHMSSPAAEMQTDAEDWRLILVNRTHPIPAHYDITLLELTNGRRVDERIYPDLQAMFDAARAEGLSVKVGEGYRTHEEQQEMMDQKIQAYLDQGCSRSLAEQRGAELVAQPGTSEHELGLAVDINAANHESPWALYGWLAKHAWEYGFILRYPKGSESVTGIDYEPWHYRYVGREAAAQIHEQGITLEEYLGE